MQVNILKKALEQAQKDAQHTDGLPALSSSHQFPERASLADHSDSDGSACKKLAHKHSLVAVICYKGVLEAILWRGWKVA